MRNKDTRGDLNSRVSRQEPVNPSKRPVDDLAPVLLRGSWLALSYIEDVRVSRNKCQSMMEYKRVKRVGGILYYSYKLYSDKVRVNEGNGLN